jgi:HSP20 family protein
MTTLTQWTPFRDLEAMERRMRPVLGSLGLGATILPATDVYETEREFVIELEAPGFEKQELGIQVSDHTLKITGERKTETAENGKTFRLRERLESVFERAFVLPPEADTEHVKATFAEGVLTVVAPKAPKLTPRKIAIDRK